MKPTVDLPDDPALPGLVAIRESGLAAALPTLDVVGDDPIEMRLCGYTAGSRATLDVQSGRRRFAIKAYAADAEPEAALYGALGAAGFGEGGRAGARVPPLLAWEPTLRMLAIGWGGGGGGREDGTGGGGGRAPAAGAA